ncbi:MAG: stage II sporulation protein M [Candidatus Woesearchaeota archaeon]
MVLESLISPENAENKPALLTFLGFIYTSLAMFLAYMIFKQYSSLFMIFLSTIASIPIVYKLIKMEEQKDMTDTTEVLLLKEHWKALSAFMYLFLGATLACTLWYVVLPPDTVSILFESQTSTIISINGRSTETITGNATAFNIFSKIFFNNIKVLLFCVLFSFIYGAGAIFILTWNASVIGVAIGNFIRTSLSSIATQYGSVGLGSYLGVVSLGLFKYAIHGIPEILAYFVGALAGGIISIAIINHDVSSRKFEHVLLDAADLLMLSIAITFIAALLEVYVTPIFFG